LQIKQEKIASNCYLFAKFYSKYKYYIYLCRAN